MIYDQGIFFSYFSCDKIHGKLWFHFMLTGKMRKENPLNINHKSFSNSPDET